MTTNHEFLSPKFKNISGLIDDEDRELIRRGVKMNLAASEAGNKIQGSVFQLHRMEERGFLSGDLFFRTKTAVAAVVDARMAGYNLPVMTSGGSGNQGIVGILTPWIVSQEMEIDDETRLRGLALSHLINSYVKSFLGELSVTCGCAMAAGIAAAVSIVYMRLGRDHRRLQFAVNNVIGDLGGFICDGAKPGCALKAISAVDTAMRSALMAIDDDGLVGTSAEESIKNLGRIALEGMFQVDPTILEILRQKNLSSGSA